MRTKGPLPRWTDEENAKLIKAVGVWGKKWTSVQSAMQTSRTAGACEQHYKGLAEKGFLDVEKKSKKAVSRGAFSFLLAPSSMTADAHPPP